MSTSYLRFDKGSPELQALDAWWQSLDDNRGDRAELRRCGTLAEVVFTPAYHRLRQRLCRCGVVHDDGLAVVAGPPSGRALAREARSRGGLKQFGQGSCRGIQGCARRRESLPWPGDSRAGPP